MSSLKNLDLNLIKVFDAIYVAGSVSAAAEKLGMSQPSVSRGLSRLRDYFDDPLFVRSGNGVVPTPKAAGMLESVRGALSLIDSTIMDSPEFDPATQTRNFKLLLPDPAEVRIMPRLINNLPENSAVTFEIFAYSSLDMSKTFSAGEIDAGVLPFIPQSKDVIYRKLYTETGALISRKNHPKLSNGFSLPVLGQLSFITLPDHIYRLLRLEEVLRTLDLKIDIVCKTHKLSSIPRIVATTDLVSFLPLDYANLIKDTSQIDIYPVPANDLSKQEVYITYPKKLEHDPAINWLCAQIDEAYAGLNSIEKQA